ERDTSAMEEGDMANVAFAQRIQDGQFFSLVPPAIPALGNAAGFTFRLQDRGCLGRAALMAARGQLLMQANQHPAIAYARPEGLEDAPQVQLDIDRAAANAQGVQFSSIASTLAMSLGSAIVNDFANAGRMQRVIVQGESENRLSPEHVLRLNVVNLRG